ncbi:MAG TPA: ribosome-binding factor A [bacterium]|nr:ribosome-binding factor A [bacterium]HPT29468.1 ribosome-binding factor A [bacterium]
MSKIDQVNELLRHELAAAILKEVELPDTLLTITYVISSSDGHYAKAGISVLPFNQSGSALKELRKKTSAILVEVKKRVKLRRFPQITWAVDNTEEKAAEIEAVIDEDEAEIRRILS